MSVIGKISFGLTQNNEPSFLYILKNKNGMEARILDYGAALVNLVVPDKNGLRQDIVLGFDDVSGYEKNKSSQGVVVGRVANRVVGGSFELNGQKYQLEKNKDEHTIRGGFDRYGHHFYQAEVDDEDNAIKMKRLSPHLEQGFPGNLELVVSYRLTENSELWITYEARSDQDTPLNLTNHSYFNLGGYQSQSLAEHYITIAAEKITEVDADNMPTGNLLSIVDTPMDLRTEARIMDRLDTDFKPLEWGRGFDHNYVLEQRDGMPDAIVVDKASGRRMTVYTDLPGMQFYTANWLTDAEIGKAGIPHRPRTAICLETQFFPNSCNFPQFPNSILRVDSLFYSQTRYCFDTI